MIKKLNNNKWYVEVYLGKDINGKRIRKTKTFKLKRDAVAFHEETLKSINEQPPKNSLKLQEYLEHWFKIYVEVNCRLQTQKRYKYLISSICKHIGTIALIDLTVKDIEHLHYKLSIETVTLKNGQVKKRYVSGTVLKCHKLLKQALDKALSWDLIVKNPVTYAISPKDNIRTMNCWTIKESGQFFNFIKHEKIYLASMIAFRTGLRCGEVCALRTQDLFLEHGYLKVNHNLIEYDKKIILSEPKTSTSKNIVYLSNDLIFLIKEMCSYKLNNPTAFICSHEDGSPFRPLYLTKKFTELVKLFIKQVPGTPKITFHGLRHTHATLLNEMGVSPLEISYRVRHTRVATTFNTYVHLTENLKKNTVKILNNMDF